MTRSDAMCSVDLPAEAASSAVMSADVPARWLPPTSNAPVASGRFNASFITPAFCRSAKTCVVEARVMELAARSASA